jgi:MFS family permease
MVQQASAEAGIVVTTPRRARATAFAALKKPDYGVYLVAGMLSMMADNIEHVISYWVMFEAFHSPMLGGFAIIAHWTPFLLFSVYFGGLADRFDCRKMIQFSQAMFIGASVAWGLLFGGGYFQVWHAVVLLIVHGMAGAMWMPASQLIIHDIVGREQLQSAVRLNSTSRQLGHIFGPGVGGALLYFLGPSQGLLVNALIYLPLTIWLLSVPYTGHRDREARPRRGSSLAPGQALDVLRQVSGNRTIVTMVALAGLSSLIIGNAYQPQMPEFAHDLGTDRTGAAYAALLGANAVGAVAGGLLLESAGLLRPKRRSALICAFVWCLAIAGFALAQSYPLALALLFLAGFFQLAFSSMAQTLVQLEAPSEVRGRVVGLFNMAQGGLRIGSGITVGVLGSFIGIHWSLGLSAGLLLAITLGLLLVAAAATQHSPATTGDGGAK